MKKLKQSIIGFISLIRLIILKIFHWHNISFHMINLLAFSAHISPGKNSRIKLGKRLYLNRDVQLAARPTAELTIGNNVFMNSGSMVMAHKKITIGNNVEFGPNVLVYDHDHDFRTEHGLSDKKFFYAPVNIGNNVWIGANSIILHGTNIGDNCVVGAGSIIHGDFPPNTIIVQKRENTILYYKAPAL